MDLRTFAARVDLSAPAEIGLAEGRSGTPSDSGSADIASSRRVSCHAYTGAVFTRAWGKAVINLANLRKPEARSRIAMLLRHSTGGMCDESLDMRLGAWDDIAIGSDGVRLAGRLFEKPLADQVLQDAKDGYPWEVSIGVTDLEPELIPPGEKRTVNGREIVGTPLDMWGCGGTYILNNGLLREGSFVELGADSNTQAEFAAAVGTGVSLHQAAEAKGISRLRGIMARLGLTREAIKQELDIDTTGVAALAAPSTGDPSMSTPAPLAPATLEQLEALPGADDAFVVAALKAKQTLGDASHALLKSMHEKLSGAAKAHAEALAAKDDEIKKLGEAHAAEVKKLTEQLASAKNAGGVTPVKLAESSGGDAPLATIGKGKHLSSLSGTDPEGDWNASQELQDYWKDHGGKKAFLAYAKEEIRVGGDYRKLDPWAA